MIFITSVNSDVSAVNMIELTNGKNFNIITPIFPIEISAGPVNIIVLLVEAYWHFFFWFQCSDKLGLSLELGSFAAGVMISTTDLAQHTLEQVRHSMLCFNRCDLIVLLQKHVGLSLYIYICKQRCLLLLFLSGGLESSITISKNQL